ncbi:hypothetical protein L6452_40622 [Arctium lappa]|uniref:Uncharacterized protein n=1 Tax=Arctium lappa TaxID=4217 RepID=A0ACB8XMZ1_ARCLA|nr:hypothetical protein L6452_40622 [Arctium lappa]
MKRRNTASSGSNTSSDARTSVNVEDEEIDVRPMGTKRAKRKQKEIAVTSNAEIKDAMVVVGCKFSMERRRRVVYCGQAMAVERRSIAGGCDGGQRRKGCGWVIRGRRWWLRGVTTVVESPVSNGCDVEDGRTKMYGGFKWQNRQCLYGGGRLLLRGWLSATMVADGT